MSEEDVPGGIPEDAKVTNVFVLKSGAKIVTPEGTQIIVPPNTKVWELDLHQQPKIITVNKADGTTEIHVVGEDGGPQAETKVLGEDTAKASINIADLFQQAVEAVKKRQMEDNRDSDD